MLRIDPYRCPGIDRQQEGARERDQSGLAWPGPARIAPVMAQGKHDRGPKATNHGQQQREHDEGPEQPQHHDHKHAHGCTEDDGEAVGEPSPGRG